MERLLQLTLMSGISYSIQGAPGAVGTVTADVYEGNPQPTATIPSGISLSHFVAITFNMNAADFSQATITISYRASDVQNIQSPYQVYKYIACHKQLRKVGFNCRYCLKDYNGYIDQY